MEEHVNVKATRIVVAANLTLIAVKLAVVLLTGSLGVFAVLVDSCFDLAGSIIAYLGVKKGGEPADLNYHFGYKKYETLSSLAQLALIGMTAVLIINEGAHRLVFPKALQIGTADLALMLFTVVVDVALVFYLRRRADGRSPAIQASMGNYASDIMQNSMVFVGLAAAGMGIYIADPIAALLVAMLMLRVVWSVGSSVFHELTDASPPKEKLEAYGKVIMSVKGVKTFHRFRARSVSGYVMVDMHLQLDPKMTLEKSHALGHEVKGRLMEKFPEITDVLTHIEPYYARVKRHPKFGN
ncbi:MAG: cation diffusion facilitator family transporter [Candidatus Micrarchaeia archaeon]